jgi:hypothetical protein
MAPTQDRLGPGAHGTARRSPQSALPLTSPILTGQPTRSAVLRAAVLALADHVLPPVADAECACGALPNARPSRMATRSGSSPTAASRSNHTQRKADHDAKASPPGRQLFNEANDRRCPGAICSRVIALDVHSSRPKRRSDDGQTILKTALDGWRLRSDLGKPVELRGFEPLTSCMPCKSDNPPAKALVASTCGDSAPVCL